MQRGATRARRARRELEEERTTGSQNSTQRTSTETDSVASYETQPELIIANDHTTASPTDNGTSLPVEPHPGIGSESDALTTTVIITQNNAPDAEPTHTDTDSERPDDIQPQINDRTTAPHRDNDRLLPVEPHHGIDPESDALTTTVIITQNNAPHAEPTHTDTDSERTNERHAEEYTTTRSLDNNSEELKLNKINELIVSIVKNLEPKNFIASVLCWINVFKESPKHKIEKLNKISAKITNTQDQPYHSTQAFTDLTEAVTKQRNRFKLFSCCCGKDRLSEKTASAKMLQTLATREAATLPTSEYSVENALDRIRTVRTAR